MLLHDLLNVEIPRLHAWAPPVAGLLSAGLALLGAHLLFTRRQPDEVSPQNESTIELPRDPFLACFAERRIAERRDDSPVEVVLCGTETAVPPRGLVLNRSLGGLALAVPLKLSAGTVVGIRRLDAGHRTPWVQFQVRHCRLHQRAWRVGGQFVNAPALSGLLFG